MGVVIYVTYTIDFDWLSKINPFQLDLGGYGVGLRSDSLSNSIVQLAHRLRKYFTKRYPRITNKVSINDNYSSITNQQPQNNNP